MTDSASPDPQPSPKQNAPPPAGKQAHSPLIDTKLPEGVPEIQSSPTAVPPPFEGRMFVDDIKQTADRLAADEATRGDLKLLSRSLKELRYAFKVFKPFRLKKKVTVFGSARTPSGHPAYEQAVEFGKQMAALNWMVLTGAGPGIMEAGNVGAGQALSMGVNILLPFEQSANRIITGDPKLVHLRYFFTRKLLFVKEVHAIALFPGGFGTMDEGFETLTLVQTGKHDLMPIVCVDEKGGTYWAAFRRFIVEQLLDRGLISPDDMALFSVTDSVEVAVAEIQRFYRVYDSMRYVRGKLMLRLKSAPSDHLLERLNDEFQDIVVNGRIERAETHALEADDPHLKSLPRIMFHFDRKHLGRLRRLIDRINDDGAPAAPVMDTSPGNVPPG